MEQMTIAQVQEMFEEVSYAMTANCEYLCALDSLLGDGDLGYTLRNGFCVFAQALQKRETDSLRGSMQHAAEEMMRRVPATMSVVLAHGILEGARQLQDAEYMDSAAYSSFLDGIVSGVARYGKCKAGDCTILDALLPAASYARTAVQSGESLETVAKAAYDGAVCGLKDTASMQSSVGKSAEFSEQSLGRPDQGAVAAEILLQAFWKYIASSM